MDACSFFFFSVSIYIPENISYLGKHKAKHRLSSEITEASLGFNFMGGVPRVSKSNAETWKLMLCSCMGIYQLYELTYTCYEQKKVQTIFHAHLGLSCPKHWTGFINGPSIGQLDNLSLHSRRLDVASELELISYRFQVKG